MGNPIWYQFIWMYASIYKYAKYKHTRTYGATPYHTIPCKYMQIYTDTNKHIHNIRPDGADQGSSRAPRARFWPAHDGTLYTSYMCIGLYVFGCTCLSFVYIFYICANLLGMWINQVKIKGEWTMTWTTSVIAPCDPKKISCTLRSASKIIQMAFSLVIFNRSSTTCALCMLHSGKSTDRTKYC